MESRFLDLLLFSVTNMLLHWPSWMIRGGVLATGHCFSHFQPLQFPVAKMLRSPAVVSLLWLLQIVRTGVTAWFIHYLIKVGLNKCLSVLHCS